MVYKEDIKSGYYQGSIGWGWGFCVFYQGMSLSYYYYLIFFIIDFEKKVKEILIKFVNNIKFDGRRDKDDGIF